MKLDRSKPYGSVSGHEWAQYEQDGQLFDAAGRTLDYKEALVKQDKIILTDQVTSAQAFLKNLLSQGPMLKSVLFSEASKNNQEWNAVKTAKDLLYVVESKKGNQDLWALPEAK